MFGTLKLVVIMKHNKVIKIRLRKLNVNFQENWWLIINEIV